MTSVLGPSAGDAGRRWEQFEVERLKASLAASQQGVPELKAALDQATASRQRAEAQTALAQQNFERQSQLLNRNVERALVEHVGQGCAVVGAYAGDRVTCFSCCRRAIGEAFPRHSLRPCVPKICQNVPTGGSHQPPVAGTEPVAPKGDGACK
jgi:hypothetical protein